MNKKIFFCVYQANAFDSEHKPKKMRPHSHASLELYYVLDGECVVEYTSADGIEHSVSVSEHQFFLIKPYVVHAINSQGSMSSINVEIASYSEKTAYELLTEWQYIKTLPYADEFLNEFRDVIVLNDTQNVGFMFSSLKPHVQPADSPFNGVTLEIDLMRLAVEIVKSFRDRADTAQYNVHIRKALKYLNSHFYSPVTVSDVAKELNISPAYLQKLFRGNLNCTVHDRLTEIRVGKTKEYITNTNLSLAQIAVKAGFKSPQSFINNFKKLTGLTPNEFKKTTFKDVGYKYLNRSFNYNETTF